MSYVLDTNIVAALMKGSPHAAGRLAATPPAEIAIPQPVVAEIAYGIARLPRSKARRRLEVRWGVISGELRRVEWTDDVSARFGEIKGALERSGELIEDFDIAIAAHALAHEAILVTGNLAHMSRVRGLRVEDWTLT
jgi:tRNA(fMet)-specific endonuclease VapC